MKILFIQSNLDDAHQLKIINNFERLGVRLTRVGYSRGNYYRGGMQRGEVHQLGVIKNSSTLGRIPLLLKSLFSIRKHSKGCDVVFCFGTDTHVLSVIANLGRKIVRVREIADIPALIGQTSRKRLPRAFLFLLERFSYNNTDCLFVTSENFIDGFYAKTINPPRCPWAVIPNKVDLKTPHLSPSKSFEPSFSKPLRIGFFGLLRCKTSLTTLTLLAEKYPQSFEVVIRGHNFIGFDFEQIQKRVPNFHYKGSYESPDDLPRIYDDCDLVWSAIPYDLKNTNMYLSRSNRFYEACYFGKPQICLTNTQDGSLVERHGLGLTVNLADPPAAVEAIASVGTSYWVQCAKNISQLHPSFSVLTNEFHEAHKLLLRLASE